MDVKDVAQNAIRVFANAQQKFGYRKREHAALTGFFKGVAAEKITVGQEWPVKLLLLDRATDDTDALIANNLTIEEHETLEHIFSSGMCCKGQALNSQNEKSFTKHLPNSTPKER